ncbi:MAG: HAD family hydrolase [Endomicrobiia bacterium]
MKNNKIISFDMDGTLTSFSYVDSVWLEGIPKLYAEKYGLSLDEAIKKVQEEYNLIGDDKLEWYDIYYWFNKFGFNKDPQKLLEDYLHKLYVYPEVEEVLSELSKDRTLILTTNSRKEFIETEMKKLKLDKYFKKIFSVTSDFKEVKKSRESFKKVCEILKIEPSELVHIGDHWEHDFLYPRELGITTYFLDRNSKIKDIELKQEYKNFIVLDLKEFYKKIMSGKENS